MDNIGFWFYWWLKILFILKILSLCKYKIFFSSMIENINDIIICVFKKYVYVFVKFGWYLILL